VRQLLIKAAKEFKDGKTPTLAHHPELNYPAIQSVGGVLHAGTDWRTLAD
jgi:hypothetical protein